MHVLGGVATDDVLSRRLRRLLSHVNVPPGHYFPALALPKPGFGWKRSIGRGGAGGEGLSVEIGVLRRCSLGHGVYAVEEGQWVGDGWGEEEEEEREERKRTPESVRELRWR